jgi:hypothetical protein
VKYRKATRTEVALIKRLLDEDSTVVGWESDHQDEYLSARSTGYGHGVAVIEVLTRDGLTSYYTAMAEEGEDLNDPDAGAVFRAWLEHLAPALKDPLVDFMSTAEEVGFLTHDQSRDVLAAMLNDAYKAKDEQREDYIAQLLGDNK